MTFNEWWGLQISREKVEELGENVDAWCEMAWYAARADVEQQLAEERKVLERMARDIEDFWRERNGYSPTALKKP